MNDFYYWSEFYNNCELTARVNSKVLPLFYYIQIILAYIGTIIIWNRLFRGK